MHPRKFKSNDRVVLNRNVGPLKKGEVGAVVEDFGSGQVFKVVRRVTYDVKFNRRKGLWGMYSYELDLRKTKKMRRRK